ncbi:MAG: aspartate kinase [Chlamydia sp. 32-24]|nr:MAG: aspartate kinase [Chlamydia sp. 32-24]
MDTIVLKFGGASVATPKNIERVADIIIERAKSYKVVVVVSAMGDMTNQLIALAHQVNKNPPKREYDMLISTGERISMALLAMCLSKRSCDAVSYTGSQSGIITCNEHADAKILDVKPYRILQSLANEKVVIVAGFQGVSLSNEITTLGRGGSDTSAVAIAISIKAKHVEFYKDVKGVYNCDPKTDKNAYLFSNLTYDEALEITEKAKILQQRSVLLAKKYALPLYVCSFLKESQQIKGTWITGAASEKKETAYEDQKKELANVL